MRHEHRDLRRTTLTIPPKRTPALELLKHYTPLVRQIAGGFQRKLPVNVLREDLIAAGMAGLWDGIRRNSANIGESFEWYIRVRIRGAIIDELRSQDWLPRRARAILASVGADDAKVRPRAVIRFDELGESAQAQALRKESGIEDDIAREESLEVVREAIDRLPPRERHVIVQHYFHGVKFKTLGNEFGVSEPRISQLHAVGMARLRSKLTGVRMPKRNRKK